MGSKSGPAHHAELAACSVARERRSEHVLCAQALRDGVAEGLHQGPGFLRPYLILIFKSLWALPFFFLFLTQFQMFRKVARIIQRNFFLLETFANKLSTCSIIPEILSVFPKQGHSPP